MNIITRTGEPSLLDTAEFKTLCKVSKFDTPAQFYIQTSLDQEKPKWMFLGDLSSENILFNLIDVLK